MISKKPKIYQKSNDTYSVRRSINGRQICSKQEKKTVKLIELFLDESKNVISITIVNPKNKIKQTEYNET